MGRSRATVTWPYTGCGHGPVTLTVSLYRSTSRSFMHPDKNKHERVMRSKLTRYQNLSRSNSQFQHIELILSHQRQLPGKLD